MDKCAYTEVAKQALMSWNGLSETEADEIVENSTFEELEEKVHAEQSITAGINFISEFLGLRYEDKEFLHAVSFDEPFELFKNDKLSIEEEKLEHLKFIGHKLNQGDENQLALYALTGIHDCWVISHPEKYLQSDRENKKYQHLPMEMIGWKEVKSDLLFLNPILKTIGIEINEEQLHRAYDEQVKRFCAENGFIGNHNEIKKDAIADKICQGRDFYYAMGNLDTITKPEEASLLATQSTEKIRESFEKLKIL